MKHIKFFSAVTFALLCGGISAAQQNANATRRNCATFRHFTMETATANSQAVLPSAPNTFANPIFPGMAPDPSITRKGGDYYLANSSFSYFPGIPVWHSTNLVDWDFCGYALRRQSQLALKEGVGLSAGVFAPDIKYNPYNDTFYLIVTVIGDRGNIVLKSKDPCLGWSEPVKVPVGGIDPSFFFEDDKTAWILNNDDAPGGKPEYPGHRTVRMRKYDLVKDEVVPGTERIIINKGVHPEEKPIWCEGPHLYKIGPSYYVMTAEGGTAIWHSEVIWRSDKLEGPYTPCPVNPILTQRDIKNATITCAGHADIIQTPEGGWWAVFLGVRPYRKGGRDWCPTGRSTFLLPVKWIGEGDARQPIILEKGREIPLSLPAPYAVRGRVQQDAGTIIDDFAASETDPMWFQIRTPNVAWYRSATNGEPGLEIDSRDVSIYSKGNPSALLRWIKGATFSASVNVSFKPSSTNSIAGLVVFHDEECNYVIGLTADKDGNRAVVLDKSDKTGKTRIAMANCPPGKITLTVDAHNDIVRFYWSSDGKTRHQIGDDEDATILTTDYAGGFVGATIGLYASEKHE